MVWTPRVSGIACARRHGFGAIVTAMNSPDRVLEVFIVHWNHTAECLETVNALRAQQTPLRITIVDNDSSVAAIQTLEAGLAGTAEIHRLDRNLGWGAALNIVLR